MFLQRAKAKARERRKENVVLQNLPKTGMEKLACHLVVLVPKVRAKARRVQTLMPMLLNVHLDLLVVDVLPANLVYVVPSRAISTFLLALGKKVVVAPLQMKKIALLVRLFSMGSVTEAQSVENGMSLIVAKSSLGAVLLETIVFLFTETQMAVSSTWAEPILLSLSENQKLKLRAKQAHVSHLSHKILVNAEACLLSSRSPLCRWNLQASRRSRSHSTRLSVSKARGHKLPFHETFSFVESFLGFGSVTNLSL